MNKNIIIAILVVIIIIGAGAFAVKQFSGGKVNTSIHFLGNETLKNGEQVQFELKDANGNAISGKSVNITFNNEKYSVTTDQNGKGYLTISGENSGKYDITVDYAGDDKYNGCTGKLTITITEDKADSEVSNTNSSSTANTYKNGSSNSSSNSGLTYDSQLGAWVDSNGVVRSGQGDGMSADDYKKWKEGDLPMR